MICVDDSGRHVMLAGDATDSLEQLQSLRADAVAPDVEVHVATLETILAHCAQHSTVYLPSHDPESAARLAGETTVSVGPVAVRPDSAAALATWRSSDLCETAAGPRTANPRAVEETRRRQRLRPYLSRSHKKETTNVDSR